MLSTGEVAVDHAAAFKHFNVSSPLLTGAITIELSTAYQMSKLQRKKKMKLFDKFLTVTVP